LTPNTNCDIL